MGPVTEGQELPAVEPQEEPRGETPESIISQATSATSVLDHLRKAQKELREEQHVDLPVPGYNGLLLVRYSTIGAERAEELNKKVMKEPKERRTLLGAVDTLIDACEGVYVRHEGVEEPQPIDPDWPAHTLFDAHLAKLLQFEDQVDSARGVVLQVFPTEMSILRTAIVLGRWMQDVTIDVSEELLGE